MARKPVGDVGFETTVLGDVAGGVTSLVRKKRQPGFRGAHFHVAAPWDQPARRISQRRQNSRSSDGRQRYPFQAVLPSARTGASLREPPVAVLVFLAGVAGAVLVAADLAP